MRECGVCGQSFQSRNPSGKARAGVSNEGQFCSRPCAANAQRRYTSKTVAKRAWKERTRASRGLPPLRVVPESTECVACGRSFRPRTAEQKTCSAACRVQWANHTARQSAQRRDRRDRSPRACQECGEEFTPAYGNKLRSFCSHVCGKRSAKRRQRKRERARLRMVAVEIVDPTVVFQRDGWKCQLCGVPTPRKLRGTFGPTAPEMDHILPLALGGEHSYRNCQCACRACNGAKGATAKGQTRLF